MEAGMMNAYRMFVGAGLAFALLAGCAGQATAVDQSQLAKIKLPPGFRISVYARVPGARSMAVAPELNAVFVSTRGPHLYAVLDRDGDHIGKTVRLIARDLRVANGIAYHNGYLYVAEQRRVMRYRPRPSVLGPIRPQVLYAGLPDKPHHGWRYAAVGPDLKLYVTVGAPCNVCKPTGFGGLGGAYESQRLCVGAVRQRRPQFGRYRLSPQDRRGVLHRQRSRQNG